MQVSVRTKRVYILRFILLFLTILAITLAYLVSERMIQKLHHGGAPVGVRIYPDSLEGIKVWGDLCLHFLNTNTSKTI